MMTRLALPLTAAVLLSACSIDVDSQGYIEREEKRFTVSGLPTINLTTFDGSIEVRGWDRNEVVVEIEKRGQDKEVVSRFTVTAEQKENQISVDVRHSGGSTYIGIGTFTSPSARLVVSAPRHSNLMARSGDGSVLLDRLDGKLEVKTSDGSIRAVETSGTQLFETGDGSITLEDVAGAIEGRTDDGTVRVSGMPSALRVRTGDGSIVLRIRRGTVMTDDWTVTTNDGSIVAELPEDFSAMIDAEPGSDSRARTDLELIDQVGGTRDNRTLQGRLGAGGKRLQLRSGDGSIRLTNY
ncbi:MAG: DUF4097 domain-containing protein [Vicinamibacterales bacterium]